MPKPARIGGSNFIKLSLEEGRCLIIPGYSVYTYIDPKEIIRLLRTHPRITLDPEIPPSNQKLKMDWRFKGNQRTGWTIQGPDEQFAVMTSILELLLNKRIAEHREGNLIDRASSLAPQPLF